MSMRESVLADLSIAEDVLNDLIEKADRFGRLMPEHVKKLERIDPDIERARLFSIEQGEGMLESFIARAQENLDGLGDAEFKATAQAREREQLKSAKEMIVEAQEEI